MGGGGGAETKTKSQLSSIFKYVKKNLHLNNVDQMTFPQNSNWVNPRFGQMLDISLLLGLKFTI